MTLQPLFILLPPLFIVAGYTEIKSRKIPNWLTGSAIVCALLGALLIGGWPGLKESLLGLIVGGGVFLPFCLAGAVGGGDLKLMSAVGAIVGYSLILWALYYTVMAGGCLAILYLIWSGRILKSFTRLGRMLAGKKEKESKGLKKEITLPYGIAIATGTISAILLQAS